MKEEWKKNHHGTDNICREFSQYLHLNGRIRQIHSTNTFGLLKSSSVLSQKQTRQAMYIGIT